MHQLAIAPEFQQVKRQSIRYFGAKAKIAAWIISHFPPHDFYHEPYCGSASVGLKKFASRVEILNDLNPGVFNFLRILQEQPQALISALHEVPRSREQFYGCFEDNPDDPIEWARRTACLGWGGYMGAGGRWSGGCSDARLQRMQEIDWSFLWAVSDRLQNFMINQCDALISLEYWDGPSTLHYVDPPYPAEARGSRDSRHIEGAPRRQYAFEMLDDTSHRKLSEVLHSLKGAVVLSGRQCPLYEELFGHWQRFDKEVKDSDRKGATESIWVKPGG